MSTVIPSGHAGTAATLRAIKGMSPEQAKEASAILNADKLGAGDARVQALGGVALAGNGGDLAGFGHALVSGQIPSEFEMVFWCRRKAGADERNRMLAALTTTGGSYTMTFGHPTYGSGLWGIGFNDTLVGFGGLQTDFHVVSYGRDSVGWFVSCDGVLDRSAFGVTGTPVSIDRIFGGIFGGYGQFAGDVSRAILFNFALSESQRAKLLLNEPGADILGRGRSLMPEITGWVSQSGGDLVLSNVTATGFSAVIAAGSYNRADTTTTIGDVPSSRRLRAKITLAGASAGGAPTLQRVSGSNLSQFPDYVQLSNGTAFYELPAFVGFDRFSLALVHHPAYGNTAASSYTFTLESLEVLGASGRWEPLNWTGSGRGVDSSGNGNDIIPVGKGVTPLNPATGLIRVIKGTVAGASVSSGAVGSIGTLTPTTVGLAAIRAGDALTASWGTVRPANAGGVTAYAPTDGAATLETAAHGAGVTVSAGTAVNIIHHLN